MLRRSWMAIGILFACAGSALATADEIPLELDDFAVGRLLHAGDAGGLQSVLLDFEVYERSIEPGLADLRVFDAEGRAVPYAIRRRLPDKAKSTKSADRVLPLFQLGAARGGGAGSEQGDYRIDAEVSDSGAIVRVFRGDGSPEAGTKSTAWLLDASALKRSVSALEFVFEPGSEDFVARIRVGSSNDLAHWKPVRSDIVVARLAQGGHRIERMRFELPGTRSKYLRLTPEGEAVLPALVEVRVEPSAVVRGAALSKEVKVVSGTLDPESDHIVLFDLAGAPSVESVKVLLPTPGTLVEGRIESSANPDGPWTGRGSELFYHYERAGMAFRNPKIDWSGRRHRYLRLTTSSRGGGLQGEVPGLEIEWVPDQLLYLDRGGAPSTLAIGRFGARDESFTPEQLLRTMQGRGESLREATARLGAERVLGGASVLAAPAAPLPWRTYALWALLIGIVGVVVGLGFRLMRAQTPTA